MCCCRLARSHRQILTQTPVHTEHFEAMASIPQDHMNTLPVVDLDLFLADPESPEAKQEAQNVR